MNKIISTFVIWIFNFFGFFYKIITFTFKRSIDSFNRAFDYVYGACDIFVKTTIKQIRESKNPYVRKFFSATAFYIGILILLIIFFFDVFFQCFYVVNIGNSAVVLRFGKYSRTTTPGLNLKIPYIERVYIVNTGNLLQESIGFRMVPKTEFGIKTPEELAAESLINQQTTLLNSGNVFTEINRVGNLTKDYIIDPHLNKVRTPRVEVGHKRAIPAQEAAEDAMGFPKNGRAPISHESQMLAGNLNLIEVTWVVQYEIGDPRKYLFNSTNAREILRNVSIAAMKQAVGDGLDFEILSTGRAKMESEALAITKKILKEMDIGIKPIFTFIIQSLPPEQVKQAYDGVSIARQEMESKMLEAQVKYNQIIPIAKGEAEKIVYKAKAYVTAVRNQAEGEAERFRLVLEEYNKEKEATWDRMYIEGMQNSFSNGKITILDPAIKGILPIFPNKDPLQEQKIKEEIYLAVNKILNQPAPVNKAAISATASHATTTSTTPTTAHPTTTNPPVPAPATNHPINVAPAVIPGQPGPILPL
ncbi:MAG: FtsH protease activity modulator HflK [Oligoflexia bacterium]|nr:FtsH protease activity modulator HflK [Oligoflexia bacterium]